VAEDNRGPGTGVRGPGPKPPDRGSGISSPEPRAPNPGLPEEPPPFGGSWSRLYAIVAAALALDVILFYAFTRAFR